MNDSFRRLKKIALGLAILIGVVALLVGVYGFCSNLYCYFFKPDSFILWGFIGSIGFAVAGVFSTYIGTKFIDSSRPITDNAWVTGILAMAMGLMALSYDIVMHRLVSDPLGAVLDVGALVLGVALVWVSKRKRQSR